MLTITFKGCSIVKPCDPTWIGTMALSEWDQTGCVTHASTIYFYRPSWPHTAIADTLKQSLSRVLVPFYPLAGRLQWIGNGRLQLQCNAMGAHFIEAECETSLDDLGDLSLCIQRPNLFPSVDYTLPIHELPLCLVQLTRFKCGGISIAIANSHAIVDGTGGHVLSSHAFKLLGSMSWECMTYAAHHFISEWARLARGDPLQTTPFHDRSVFRAGEPPLASPPPSLDDYPEYGDPELLLGQSDSSEERKKKTTTATLRITKAQVEQLKKMANESWAGEKPVARGFTRYETICEHIWRIACKARGHRKEQPTALAVCVDSRSRMRPQLPREYFGAATFDVITQSVAGDLMSKPLGFGASKVREAIEKVTDKYVRSGIEFLKSQKDLTKFQDIHAVLEKEEGPFYGNPHIEVVSWLTLPIYGFDFGWGKEEFMSPGPCVEDGTFMLLQSHEGDGSVVLVMCLQIAHMDDFKKLFHQDMM